jgi:DNA-binding transcriptional MerR regulator
MKIGEVSMRVGLPASTIRYYEKIGLVEPQPRVSGRREFNRQALFALEFVKLAQTAGFSIEETRQLLVAYSDNPGPSGAWVSMAEQKRSDIRTRISELSQMDQVLTKLLSCDCVSLVECVEHGIAQNKADKC